MSTALNYIPASEVAKMLGVCQQTVVKWIRFGCKGRKLRGWRIGHSWYTTPEAIEEFSQPNDG